MSSKPFIWKQSKQDEYYLILSDYLNKLFTLLKNKKHVFYLEYDIKNDHEILMKYFNDREDINIKDFYKPKKFDPDAVKGYHENRFEDDDYKNIAFSITDFEIDTQGNEGGCRQCKIRYGAGVNFTGLAYNTKYNGDTPVEYEGWIKTNSFFSCKCDPIENESIYHMDDNEENCLNSPWVEIVINPNDISLLRRCMLFHLKYTEL